MNRSRFRLRACPALVALLVSLGAGVGAGPGANAQSAPPAMKRLHPKVQSLLGRIGADYGRAFASAPQTPQGALEANRAGNRALAKYGGVPKSIFAQSDRTIAANGRRIPIRLYRPRASNRLPVLVFFHGGGFTAGELSTYDAPLRAFRALIRLRGAPSTAWF